MSKPQHLVIVNEIPVEIMATPPTEYGCIGGTIQPNVYELGRKWRNVHLILESDAGYDKPVAGDIDIYLYHTKDQKAAYFTTLTVAEDSRCDIALPESMLGAQFIGLVRGEAWPYFVLGKLPDITGAPADNTLELTLVGDEFDAGGAINLANWTLVDVSGTGLVIAGVVRDSATQVTITFTPPGVPVEGIITLQANAAAFTSAAEDSRVFTLVTDDAVLSVTSESAPAGVIMAQIMHEGHYGW